jgi:hypothetical protein
MIIGNITLSSRPTETRSSGIICLSCLEECSEVGIDESFDDCFGSVTCWNTGSSCCESVCVEGRIFLDKSRIYTARKDYEKEGIKAGERYRARVVKGYYIENHKHIGIFKYIRKKIKQ